MSYAIDTKSLLKDVKENLRKLRSCEKHNFGEFDDSPEFGKISRHKMKCSNCGGLMEVSKILIYRQGFKAAGGNENDVFSFRESNTTP